MAIARTPEDLSKTLKNLQKHPKTFRAIYTLIRCTFLARYVVAHPMVIARALPDSPVPPEIMIFPVFRDPVDSSFSKCRCESDGASRSGSSSSG
eukprot:10877439-Heterocapsa_arctica.AAC.1